MDRTEQRKQLLKQAVRLYNEGNPAEALPIYLKCLDLFGDEERSSLEFADFCGNYGSALAESGNQKLAEKVFTSALLIYGSQNQREELAQTHFNLGNVYFYVNSRQPCQDHYMQALDGYRALGDSSGEGQCLLQLANFYAGMGLYDVAREWLAKIDGLDDSFKHDPTFRWSWLFQQAKVALHEGQPEYALKLLNEALDCARQTKIPAYIEETESAIATIRASLGQSDALPQLEQAYKASKDRRDRYLLTRAYELARAVAEKGEWKRASALYDECLDLMDTGRGALDGAERFHWMERLATLSRELCWLLFRYGQHEKSLEVSERGQGRVLLDLMFRHQIKLQGGRTIRAAGNGRVILDASTWPEILAVLRSSEAHLFKILEMADGTLGWLATQDGGVECWPITTAHAALERMIDLLLQPQHEQGPVRQVRAERPATRVAWQQFEQTLATLYEALFPESVRKRLEETRGHLLIVPHLSYFHVPWATLGPAKGPALGANWEIAVTPSVGVFMQLDRRRDPEPWPGLAGYRIPAIAVGDCGAQTVTVPAWPGQDAPTLSLSFGDLPGAREEVQRVAELLNGNLLVGANAHPAAVRAIAPIAGVVHLATHGYWHLASGELSFLVLAPAPALEPGTVFATGEPGTLFAYEVMADSFATRAELVTLSGCQTGLGSAHPDTYINLAHSFLVAGARSVLVSLWPIRDDAAAAFMREFYMELKNGRSPAEALESAQHEMSKSILWNDGWDWSGFVLVGNPFHGFAPEPDARKTSGPAFCGGDVLVPGAAEGSVVDLKDFENERQAPDEAWLLRKGEIVKISKRGRTQ